MAATTTVAPDVAICKVGGRGFILPAGGDDEQQWPDAVRVTLYSIGLIYFFLGVSIISDIFMGAIECITSRRAQRLTRSGRVITVRTWNDTVANLTLMALGSSAPEILLAVTELLKKGMFSGDLGAATIVGSASFNLFMIVGLCIFIIPSPETRKVREVPVFIVTVVFMFFAYFWVVIMVSVITPDEVEPWEALVTLFCLPVLVGISYLADIGKFGDLSGTAFGANPAEVLNEDIDRVCELLGSFDREAREAVRVGLALTPSILRKLENPSSTDIENLRFIVKKHTVQKKSRAARRVEATRMMTGGKKIMWDIMPTVGSSSRVTGVIGASFHNVPLALPKGSGLSCVQFACETQQMSEELLEKSVMIVRTGDTSQPIKVQYEVTVHRPEEDKSAGKAPKASSDLSQESKEGGMLSRLKAATPSLKRQGSSGSASPIGKPSLVRQNSASLGFPSMLGRQTTGASEVPSFKGYIEMEAGEERKEVTIKRPEGVALEGAHDRFFVDLVDIQAGHISEGAEERAPTESPQLAGPSSPPKIPVVGGIPRTAVVICSAQSPGTIAFAYERILVHGSEDTQTIEVLALRQEGCSGKVECCYRTERLSAVPGFDFTEIEEGQLEFDEGVTEQFIDVEILTKRKDTSKHEFMVVLEDIEGGAEFNHFNDGGAESEILTVEVAPRNLLNTTMGLKLGRWLDQKINFEELRLGNQEWGEQFTGAIYCNGSADEQAEASAADWVFHIVALPWKFVFMFVPPTTYASGWICFWLSLVFIGVLTTFIGDLAELFGCVLDVPNIITAISFVALGTSMPDLFASKSAAMGDPFADASIVNVTGSNSVNVFLGLGMPWTLAAFYWRYLDPLDESDAQVVKWKSLYPDVLAKHPSHMSFVVKAGELGFSVGVFTLLACVALAILGLRRHHTGAELGGPFGLKVISAVALVFLWFLFIATSSWWSLEGKDADISERLRVLGGCCAVGLLPSILVPFVVWHRKSRGLSISAGGMGHTSSSGSMGSAAGDWPRPESSANTAPAKKPEDAEATAEAVSAEAQDETPNVTEEYTTV